jgi:GNAT superfamily N-acetyltransferase
MILPKAVYNRRPPNEYWCYLRQGGKAMLQVKPVTKENKHDREMINQIKTLYCSAFPPREQVPLAYLIGRTKQDNAQFNAYYEGDMFVGLTYAISYKDMTYLWYLATDSSHRSKGYGTKIMQNLRETYPSNRIVLNLDAQDATAHDSEIRKRRKEFYMKNGYTSEKYSCTFNRNHLDIMTIGGSVSSDEFLSIFRNFFGFFLNLIAAPKIIEKKTKKMEGMNNETEFTKYYECFRMGRKRL